MLVTAPQSLRAAGEFEAASIDKAAVRRNGNPNDDFLHGPGVIHSRLVAETADAPNGPRANYALRVIHPRSRHSRPGHTRPGLPAPRHGHLEQLHAASSKSSKPPVATVASNEPPSPEDRTGRERQALSRENQEQSLACRAHEKPKRPEQTGDFPRRSLLDVIARFLHNASAV
jgi:hypothetical protein